MPRFYFDIHDGLSPSPDLFGEEIDCFGDAREQAQAILSDVAAQCLPDGEARTFTCEVRDNHSVVYRCSLTLRGEVLHRPR